MKEVKSVWDRISLLALTCAASIISAEAYAQASSDALEEIVVTATRRSADLQNTAISASVLSGDVIDDKAVFDLYEL
ncbi:MAG: hypothetical protein ACREUU_05570, partial [Gammaproteobacteria bacterium]